METFASIQLWLNLTGLMSDFTGVILLAHEWRVAMRAERHEAALAEREALLETPPSVPRPGGPHREMFDYMDRKRKSNQRAMRARTAFTSRSKWFVLAFAFIAVGFLLQIVAAIPI